MPPARPPVRDAGHAARRGALALRERLRRDLRCSAGGIADLDGLASVAEETSSWPYRHDRDLTGFIDGTENPTLIDAPDVSLVPDGSPGAGGAVLLLQKWAHDVAAWESLPVARQEEVMGRTKPDSIEVEEKAPDSHVASTDQDRFGKVFRRNMPYGNVTDHGTMFVGFSADQGRARRDAPEHGRPVGRRPRRAHAFHAAAHRGVLIRARRRAASPLRCPHGRRVGQATRRVVHSRIACETPLSSTGPISVNLTPRPPVASTTA